jgi:hypothetical protein
MPFCQNGGLEGKTGLSWGWYQWDREGWKERVQGSEYGGNIVS